MDRLWAGWRSEYIEEVTADEGVRTCSARASSKVGCPTPRLYIVWRGASTFVILNRFPYISGHVLVMPYREVNDIEALTPEEHTELWATVTDAVRAIKTAYNADGLNIGVNLGSAGGAGVPDHLHVHVMPRWNADSNFMTSVAEARVLPEALSVTWRKLRDAWPSQ